MAITVDHTIPSVISTILIVSTAVIGILCVVIPTDVVNFLFSSSSSNVHSGRNYYYGDFDDVDDVDDVDADTTMKMVVATATTTTTNSIASMDATAVEQFLTRIIGCILVAYSLNCCTFAFLGNVGKKKKIPMTRGSNSMTPSIGETEGEGGGTGQVLTKANITHRINLLSSIYLGMGFLLVAVFEATTKESDVLDIAKLLSIASAFVILGLLGLIASFFPGKSSLASSSNSTNQRVHNNNRSLCCWKTLGGQIQAWNSTNSDEAMRLPMYTNGSNNSSNDGGGDNNENNFSVDPDPLLENDHLSSSQNQNQSQIDEWEDQPQLEESNEQEQDQRHQQQEDGNDDDEHNSSIGGRITGTRRLIKLAGPHSLYLFIGCVVLLIRLPFSLSIPHFVSVTLGALARTEYDVAKMNIFLLFIFGTLDAALDFFCVYLFGLANLKISRGVRIQLFNSILGQEVSFFDATSSGTLASRLNSDCGEMAGDLTWFFRFSIESVVRISGITLYMFLRAPRLAMCAVSVVPIVALVNKKYGDWLSKNAKDVQTALAEANSVAQEALLCIRTVIAFASEEIEQKKYKCKVDKYYRLNVKQLYATGFYYMFISTFLINTCVQALMLYVGMILIGDGQMKADVLLAFMLYQSQLQSEVMNLFNSYTSLVKSSGAGDKVFELLDRAVPSPGTGSFVQPAAHDQENIGDISIQNVSFSYQSRSSEVVLRDLNLEIPAGKTVALVARSGGGKTTVFSLLQRFYDPSLGNIRISGIDLKDMNLTNYRKRIGVVTQDPVLFTGTIKSNIAYCAPDDTNMDEIIEAAKLANAHSFIESFPLGYETEVGERGVQLSGGQKQRVAIARAIISKPKLLLLDEATSALDTESEKLVQKALDDLLSTSREMTTLVIAHRLQTVRNADKIVVLDEGRVIEEGSHDELIHMRGLYYQMAGQSDGYNIFH